MKKLIGAALVATLMGSLSANAAVILSDDFTVTGGANADVNAEWDSRQTGTSISPYSTDASGGATATAEIVNDFGNGGTAKVSGTLNDVQAVGLIQNNWMTGLAGEEWEATFFATVQKDAAYDNGWFGVGISSEVQGANSPFGEFGAIHREGGNVSIFIDGAYITNVDTGWDPYTSLIHYNITADEVAGTMSLSYDAYDFALTHLGHVDVIDGASVLGGVNRGIDFRLHADTAVDADVAFLVDNLVVQTIPEPATLGLFAAFGGTALFIRRKFMI